MTTPQRLSAILFTAYMLALMWTMRARGQVPPQQTEIAAPAEVAPLALEPLATPQARPLPRVQLASPEELNLTRPAAATDVAAAGAATHARWLVASGGSLLVSAAIHMAAFGRQTHCSHVHGRFVAPFISGGIVALPGAILLAVGVRRWRRLQNPAPASESQRIGLFFGATGIALGSQAAMLLALAPEGSQCLSLD